MSLHYKQFKATGHPKPVSTFKITDNSWRIYLLCTSSGLSSCCIFDDARSLEQRYLSQYKNMMMMLGQRCESGKSLDIFYDKKGCHPILNIKIHDKEEKIWRIRQGDLRLCFVYLPPEKRIILLRLFVKKSDKLKSKERSSLESLAKQVLTDDVLTFNKRVIP